MVNGQILNSIGYVRYVGSVSRVYKLGNASIANLKLVQEFFPDPIRQPWLRSTTGQEQIVLKINDLREDRRPLTNLLRVLWRLSVRRDKLQACSIDDVTSFLNVLTSEVEPPEDKATRRDGERGLHLEVVVVPFLNFCQLFPHKLRIFRLKIESGRGVDEIRGEVHPVRTGLVHEKRMDHGVGRVSFEQGFWLSWCEMDPQFVVVQQRR
jgi:hypothetical protein